MALDLERIRRQFPALARRVGEHPATYLDGPGGSQVPERVAAAMTRYLLHSNANHDGRFATSIESDALIERARAAVADLLGTSDPRTVVFGANMTTLTFALSRALARTWDRGDEVVVTRLDHDANVSPWTLAAADAGATVRHVGIRTEDATLDLDDLASSLSSRTRLVAVGCASNAVGTVNPVARIVEMAHQAGALVFLDAVHHAPHLLMDVEAWNCDFLACSPYKFFGPHAGVLYGRHDLLQGLPAYKVRPADDAAPGRWETGTQSHEAMAGVREAVEYLADLGGGHGAGAGSRRVALSSAFAAIHEHERRLSALALERLADLPDIRVYGITDPERLDERTPTFGFTHARRSPREVASALAEKGIFVWDGNFYALPLTEALDLEPGGMVRAGFLHYNTEAEVERLAEALAELG